MEDERSLAEIIESLTWEQITEDGITTVEEIDAMLRAKGLDPNKYDYLYD